MVNVNTARKFTFDVGWVFVASIAAMGFGLLIRILLGNYFDASGLGAYAMVLTIWGIVTLTTGAIIKFVAECTAKGDKEMINKTDYAVATVFPSSSHFQRGMNLTFFVPSISSPS